MPKLLLTQINSRPRKKSNLTNILLTIDNQTIQSAPSVELLGIYLNGNLNFNLHISNICRSAMNQLNALIRRESYLAFNAKRILNSSYTISHFLNIILWFGYLLLLNPWTKLEVCKKERFDSYTIITQYLMKVHWKKRRRWKRA